MYEKYWGLIEKPFENTPNPRYIYYSLQHKEALMRMLYAVKERKGAAMLTGDYGCGKTVLSRVILEELDNNKYDLALITNPPKDPLELLKEIGIQLGINELGNTKPELLQAINVHLYKNIDREKDTVIIIDEAQVINDNLTFDELRLLLNFQLNDRFLLTLLLLGQPELRGKIKNLEQFQQRLGIRYHLSHLNRIEIENYILHRLKISGLERTIFSKRALDLIYLESEGVPRKINNLCDTALLVGCGRQKEIIDEELILELARDMRLSNI